ncbi:uncharacterized protein LOC123530043 [Mercenaria mercenaria]|uniref:uncharacterized protein LOC123530043 n=1 Tax=Mercenaria mercenaria TaxID=6596 RepID=UPI001E1DED6A|nr:uncharacterized protein LOC123530043 [Mercenaria mercenaria]
MLRPDKSLIAGGGLWDKKRGRNIKKPEDLELDNLGCDSISYSPRSSVALFAVELGESIASDSFQKKVANKTKKFLIGKQEAEIDVFTDILVEKKGDVDKALLFVISEIKPEETKRLVFVNNLIHRGANISTTDSEFRTPLHHAVKNNHRVIAAKLLENDAIPILRDKNGTLPLKTAMDEENDDICALLLAYMPNAFVRELFVSNTKKAEFSIHDLVRLDANMQKTILSILDCLIETSGSSNSLTVYYDLLECDNNGRTPSDSQFNESSKSALQIIAKKGNKNIIYHDAVRLLIRRKWKEYAQRRFQLNSLLYIIGLFCITYSAIVAVMAPDPTVYSDRLQISRAVFEVLSCLMIGQTVLIEINQMRRHKIEYFHDTFNWFDFSSSILLICVIPLRFLHIDAQWHVFAFGYLIWTIRILKFAAVFRQTGTYTQILARIITHDFIQFGVVFLVILLAFSGSFFLSLRGDKNLDTHHETSTFLGILFVGVRSLTEAQPIVDYTGEEGYGTISVIFMVCFLFTCIVILLNILIAQLSDTYQKVQQDAQRGLEADRAWIVAGVELNSFFCGRTYRKDNYKKYEDFKDLKKVLTKWESPPLNETNKYVKDIWDTLDNQKMSLLTIQHRQVRQENILRNIQDQLHGLFVTHTTASNKTADTGHPSSTRPEFYRSDTEPETSGSIQNDYTVDANAGITHLLNENSIALDDVQAEIE